MQKVPVTTEDDDLTPFELVMLILSIYVLGILFVQTAFRLSANMDRLLGYLDTLICLVFIYDFFQRLFRARDRLDFLKWNWIDLVSSIPAVSFLRVGRIVRIFRVLRLLRAFRSTRLILRYIFQNRAQGILATVGLTSALLTLSSSIAILSIETTPESNIRTPSDALLWSFALLTTVGMADKYPVTTGGRVLSVVLMVCGATLIGTFTGYVANYFISSARREEIEPESEEMAREVQLMRERKKERR